MSSEERELPASQQKLRRAREQGQVARSADLNAAALLIATVVYLFVAAGPFLAELRAVWTLPLDLSDQGRPESLRVMAAGLGRAVIGFLGPLFGAAIIGVVVAELVMKRGIVLSFASVMPKFDALNPMTGLQNLLSLRRLVDLVKAIVKFVVLGLGGGLVLAGTVGVLVWMPRCGVGCVAPVFAEVMRLVCGVAIAVFALNGLLDMRLQAWLFLRDQRMSKTERKQEAKNQDQNPEIKREIARQTRADGGVPVRQISIVIGDAGAAIAVRYVEGEMPAPVCVAKLSGGPARKLIAQALKNGVPVHDDPTFAETHFAACERMSFMPTECYGELSGILRKYGLF